MSKSDRVPSSTVELGIKFVQIAALHSYGSNARTHSARQIRQIARSIERFGFTNPVLIDGNNKIICGHGRVAAAQLLGLTTVPTLKIEHLSDEEVRAYVIADNRLAQKAGWNKEILAIELQGLLDLNFEVELDLKAPKSIYFWRISMQGRMNLMTLALHMNLNGLLLSQMISGFSDLIGSFAAMRVTDPPMRY